MGLLDAMQGGNWWQDLNQSRKDNRNALMMAGLGLMSGQTPQAGFQNAIQGFVAGRGLDGQARERKAKVAGQNRTMDYMMSQWGMQEPEARMILANGGFHEEYKRRQQAKSNNKTMNYLQKNRPDLYEKVQAGMPVNQAWKMVNQPAHTKGVTVGNNLVNPVTGEVIYEGAQKAQQAPTSVQEYEYSLANPGYNDYRKELKKAGASRVTVSNQMGGQNEYDKAMNKSWAQENLDISKRARAAHQKIGKYQYLGELLKNPDLYQGAGGEMVLKVKGVANSLGMEIDQQALADGQAALAIGNQLALALRNPAGGEGMPGALSDKDREFLVASVPGLSKTEGGNGKLIEYAIRLQEREIQLDDLRWEYTRKFGRLDDRFYDHVAQWAKENPLFPEAAQGQYSSDVANGVTQTGMKWGVVE
ncbi:MAG: hypothetical protein N4A65_00340 [Cohaesibacter sp.]|jgi:hypothetical protein|nr:hypothetical protein [Cohaesibacter sp.]